MKKLICLVLCLAMVMTSSLALAREYTMSEKLMRQLEKGSGLKGTVTLDVSGEAEWAKLLAPMSGLPIELRAIGKETGDVFYHQLFTMKGEDQHDLLTLFSDGKKLLVTSPLLPGTALTMQTAGDALGTLMSGGAEKNPNWYSALANMMAIPEDTWTEDWEPKLAKYYSQIEMWLSGFGAAPSVMHTEKGETRMLIRYEVPAKALKKELVTLVKAVLEDNALLSLVREQLTDAQRLAYLHPDLLWYYEEIVNAMPLTGSAVLEREITIVGDVVRTKLIFPLAAAEGGWNTLQVEQEGEDTSLSLQGDEKTLQLVLKGAKESVESASWQGIVRMIPAATTDEEKAVSAAFDVKKFTSTSVDNDTREHVVTNWEVTIQSDLSHLAEGDPARASYMDFAPVTAKAKVHFHSKNAQTSPTTLEVDGEVVLPDAVLGVQVNVKSAAPWAIPNLEIAEGEDIIAMTAERRAELLSALLGAVAPLNAPAETPAPTAEPTAEPTVEPTVEPTAAPTAVPTAEPTPEPAEESAPEVTEGLGTVTDLPLPEEV